MPSETGRRTTLVVAVHKDIPLILKVLPIMSLTRRGVTADARIVEQAVRRTERATSALAMSATKLEAVPPGEQPTNTRPKYSEGPLRVEEFSRREVPMRKALRGMIMNWQRTPNGIEDG